MYPLPCTWIRAIGPKDSWHGEQLDVPLVLIFGVVEGEGVHEEPLHFDFCTEFLPDLPFQGDIEGLASFYLRSNG